ncbi:hypothetical protein J6590_026420 [Homalodisca vitripennis]|nr:hypothetical protein J6590_026420 [Homalodisca vitripennis]
MGSNMKCAGRDGWVRFADCRVSGCGMSVYRAWQSAVFISIMPSPEHENRRGSQDTLHKLYCQRPRREVPGTIGGE